MATANDGYEFVRWDDNVTDNPRTVILYKDEAFTAIFNQLQGIVDVETNLSIEEKNRHIWIHSDIPQTIVVYSAAGHVLTIQREVTETQIPVSEGLYIVRANNQSYKVIVK